MKSGYLTFIMLAIRHFLGIEIKMRSVLICLCYTMEKICVRDINDMSMGAQKDHFYTDYMDALVDFLYR